MRFRFDEKKASQAACLLLNRHGGSMNYMAMIKLLYLADRAALLHCGQPITGDRLVSMPHGPVLSMVLDFINSGSPQAGSAWTEAISPPSNYEVRVLADPGLDELSQFEIGVIEQVDKDYGHFDPWALVKLTHQLPEWHDPEGSSIPIPPEEILRCEGKSAETIERIAKDAEELWFFDRLTESSRDAG